MNPLSFSKMELVATCPAAGAIPWVEDLDDDNDRRDEGKVAHRFLELVSKGRERGLPTEEARDVALAQIPDDDRHIAAVIDIEHLPVDLRAEVSFAWNWKTRTGRYLGQGLDRRYQALPEGVAPIDPDAEIPGTVDILGHDPENATVLVGDYKRGVTRYPRPGVFAQTLLGGLAAASVLGAERAVLDLVYLNDDGESFLVRDEVDLWDLERGAERIARAVAAAQGYAPLVAAGAPVPLVTGKHCRYCPARKNCNATTALVRALPERFESVLAEGPWRDLALDRRARRYHLVVGLKRLLEDMLSEVYADAAANPIDLGDGTVLRAEPYEREKLVGDVAYNVLAGMVGKEAADRAVKRSVSKDAAGKEISEALEPGQKFKTKKGDGMWDRFMREVRAKNGTTWERGETVRPVKIRSK